MLYNMVIMHILTMSSMTDIT